MLETRRHRIVRLVREHGSVTMDTLLKLIDASPATIRRDLAYLDARGLIRRTWGGAAAVSELDEGPDWMFSRSTHRDKKIRVGEAAAKLVKPGLSISIENGTTTFELARALLKTPGIRVVTNSLGIAYLLNMYGKCRELALTGGLLRQDAYLYGPMTRSALENFVVDIAFVGAMGLSVERGITDRDTFGAEVKRDFIRNARKVVLLADHRKIDHVEPIFVDHISCVDIFVTTSEAPQAILDDIRQLGVEVIVC